LEQYAVVDDDDDHARECVWLWFVWWHITVCRRGERTPYRTSLLLTCRRGRCWRQLVLVVVC